MWRCFEEMWIEWRKGFSELRAYELFFSHDLLSATSMTKLTVKVLQYHSFSLSMRLFFHSIVRSTTTIETDAISRWSDGMLGVLSDVLSVHVVQRLTKLR